MLNMNISILTTGVSPQTSFSCIRCKPQTLFNNETDLRKHTETVHHRIETEEEREGRIQRARWTHIKPDTRIRETIPNERAEDLVLMHEDDVHYNLIVHKSHNAYKSDNSELSKSWAQVTKAYRPGMTSPKENTSPQASCTGDRVYEGRGRNVMENVPVVGSGSGWKKVGKRGNLDKHYTIPVQNRFEVLPEDDEIEITSETFQCEICNAKISTKTMLKTHMKIHKNEPLKQCKCSKAVEYEKMLNEVKTLRKHLENSQNENKVLKDYKDMKQNEGKSLLQGKSTQVRQSVITLRCKDCQFITKHENVLNTHTKSHKELDNQCQLCNVTFNSEGILHQHMLNEHKERIEQLNCNMCSFQSSERKEIMNHIPTHGVADQILNAQLNPWKCRNCGELFESKHSLMDHRRDNHVMPMCHYDIDNKCNQLPEVCWYQHKQGNISNHRNVQDLQNKCFTCQEEFISLGSMMEHRKTNHPELVKLCTKAATGECRRVKCWFHHEN